MSTTKWFTIASTVVIGVVALAVSASRRPMLVSISPDPSMVRPRNYCIMNPFRDRSPERASERYLTALRNGHVDMLAEVVPDDVRDHIIDSERKWPIQSWRIGRRQDTADTSDVLYWVKRGHGYARSRDYEEVVLFQLVRSRGTARVVSFSAVY